MKTALLSICACLLLAFAAAAQSWPINPQTKQVELSGKVPYPVSVKTEAGRKAFVRQWYMKHLTDFDAQLIADIEKSNATNGLLTYGGLPLVGTIQANNYILSFRGDLRSTATNFTYKLSGFYLATANLLAEPDGKDRKSLEEALDKPMSGDSAALAELRKRLP